MDAIYFGMSAAFGIIAWATIFNTFIWPKLQAKPQVEQLKLLTAPHFFRYLGTTFLIVGLVVHKLPAAFANPAAFGDLITALLAYTTFTAMRRGSAPGTYKSLAWIFNVFGTIDLLVGAIVGPLLIKNIGDFGVTYLIPTFYVPLLFVTHYYSFKTLRRSN